MLIITVVAVLLHGGMKMLENNPRLTDRARRVLALANREARRLNHEHVLPVHILLGLVSEGTGVAANVLKNFGVNLRDVRTATDETGETRSDSVLKDPVPLSDAAERVGECAQSEAERLGHHDHIGTEHLLLGLIKDSGDQVKKFFEGLGVKLEEIREETVKLVRDPSDSSEASRASSEAAPDEMGERLPPGTPINGAETTEIFAVLRRTHHTHDFGVVCYGVTRRDAILAASKMGANLEDGCILEKCEPVAALKMQDGNYFVFEAKGGQEHAVMTRVSVIKFGACKDDPYLREIAEGVIKGLVPAARIVLREMAGLPHLDGKKE